MIIVSQDGKFSTNQKIFIQNGCNIYMRDGNNMIIFAWYSSPQDARKEIENFVRFTSKFINRNRTYQFLDRDNYRYNNN